MLHRYKDWDKSEVESASPLLLTRIEFDLLRLSWRFSCLKPRRLLSGRNHTSQKFPAAGPISRQYWPLRLRVDQRVPK